MLAIFAKTSFIAANNGYFYMFFTGFFFFIT